MSGYLSLFYDDSSAQLPSTNLEQAKSEIFKNYKKVFHKPNPKDKEDLEYQLTNRILSEIAGELQQGNAQGEGRKSDPIRY